MAESKTKWVLKVLSDQNIVILYNEEKEFREGPYTYSNDTSVYHSINQIYRYGVLSTYDQTWFLERGVTGEDYG
ncbi:8285_t:CDS:2 [Funneliformis geosporum]|uniref:8285_t:CDS:1 n=1 Tax=Funneliformis geosporum TaxID=1117311 RepID=A0A9W4X012_9GLOM|nr:8285_t:CDS:2 [Funneliformis geosporum]